MQSSRASVLVAAAASLQVALDEIIADYQTKNLRKVELYTAASGVLARQISWGARVNIFISANSQWVNFLADKNLLDLQNIYVLGFNRLVVVKNCSNKQTNLLAAKKIAVGDFAYVPVGIYAKNYLQRAGLLASIKQRLVFTSNENQAVQYIRKDLLDMAFVYFSSFKTYKKLCLVSNISSNLAGKIAYQMAVVSSASNEATLLFVEFLRSKNSLLILQKYGVSPNWEIMLDN